MELKTRDYPLTSQLNVDMENGLVLSWQEISDTVKERKKKMQTYQQHIKQSQAYKYATFAASDKEGKVPKYVKMQAQQWKDIADNKKNRKLKNAYICEKTFKKIESILSLMIHPDLNKPLSECLEDYAAFFIFAVLTTKTREREGTGKWQQRTWNKRKYLNEKSHGNKDIKDTEIIGG